MPLEFLYQRCCVATQEYKPILVYKYPGAEKLDTSNQQIYEMDVFELKKGDKELFREIQQHRPIQQHRQV